MTQMTDCCGRVPTPRLPLMTSSVSFTRSNGPSARRLRNQADTNDELLRECHHRRRLSIARPALKGLLLARIGTITD